MSLIIPYNEEIIEKDGAFIKPNGEVVLTYINAEGYAKEYCEGYYAEVLRNMQKGNMDFYLTFSEIAKMYGYNGSLEDVDVYLSSSLNKEQLIALRKWISMHQNKCEYLRNSMFTNYLVQVLGWDKIYTILQRRIITTYPDAHTRYWNYSLMDFDINVVPPQGFNPNKGEFETSVTDNWKSLRELDRQRERQSEKIKRKYPLEERSNFFNK